MTEGLDQPDAPEVRRTTGCRFRARSIRKTEGVDAFQALQRVLYRSAKQDPKRRFHALYDKLTRRDVMWRAWVDVATNQGAPGVDGVSHRRYRGRGNRGGRRPSSIELAAELEAETYRPRPLRRVNIPKPGQPGKHRPLSIPCVRDRVVMAAAKSILEPIFEADFLPCSFGFRPKRSAHQALEAVRTTANNGAVCVLDADISDCFGSLSFDAIVSQMERRVSDRKMLKLIRAWLRVGVLEDGVVTDSVTGAPQGSPVSPLIANVVLHVLDEAWSRQGQGLGTLVRYCDDFVVLTSTRARAVEAKARIEAILAPLGLHLHPDKTRIACLRQGAGGLCLPGLRASDARVSEVAGSLVSIPLAVSSGHGLYQGQGQRANDQAVCEPIARSRCRGPQPRAAGMGDVLSLRQLGTEVRCDRQLRPSADGLVGQRQVRAPRSELGHPLYLRVVHRIWGSTASVGRCDIGLRLPEVNGVGEPDEWRTSCPDR